MDFIEFFSLNFTPISQLNTPSFVFIKTKI